VHQNGAAAYGENILAGTKNVPMTEIVAFLNFGMLCLQAKLIPLLSPHLPEAKTLGRKQILNDSVENCFCL